MRDMDDCWWVTWVGGSYGPMFDLEEATQFVNDHRDVPGIRIEPDPSLDVADWDGL